MKRERRSLLHIIITSVLIVGTASLSGAVTPSHYPDVDDLEVISSSNMSMLDTDSLEQFLLSWAPGESRQFSDLRNEVVTNSTALESLRSLSKIQDAQYEQTKREGYPKFSFVTSPSSPLYGYSDYTTDVYGVRYSSLTHTVSLAAAVSQQLPTAGSLDLSLSNITTYTSDDGGSSWTWEQSPSATLSLSQPLFVNGKILDSALTSKALKLSELLKEDADTTLEDSIGPSSRRAVALVHTYLNLKESRWLLHKEALLSEKSLENEKENAMKGLISDNDLVQQKNRHRQLLIQLETIDNEINALEDSLRSSGLSSPFVPPVIDIDDITYVSSFNADGLVDNENYLQIALTNDQDYQKALRNLEVARIENELGQVADAPLLQLSLNYSPYYSPSSGNTLEQSFSSLFSSSTEHNVSFSVSFTAADFSRSLSKASSEIAQQQLLQAQIELQNAYDKVKEKLRDLQSRINTALDTLMVNQAEYELADENVEIEQLKASVGLSDEQKIERASIERYQSAFALIASVRTIYELKLELESLILIL